MVRAPDLGGCLCGQMMDGGMMLGDVGGLIGVILLILIIAVFVLYGFRG